jgi:serine/threonine protein kinase
MKGMTGSMRYMAPEVANARPYNHTCDVYSFAILLWQLMALKTPFEMYIPKSLRENVYNGRHSRPKIDTKWPLPIQICMKRGWAKDIHERLSMKNVEEILRKEIVRIREGDETGLEHNRRRSTFVFRGNDRK